MDRRAGNALRPSPGNRVAGTVPGEGRTLTAFRETGPPPSRSQAPRSPLRERHLAHIWEGQRFPPSALSTRDGRRLGVVYRGRAVGGPGPDFRDAIIEAPWGILRGDVELHVRASDFNRACVQTDEPVAQKHHHKHGKAMLSARARSRSAVHGYRLPEETGSVLI